MWQTLLKYIPALLMNSAGPIADLIQSKGKKKLAQIKVYCDQVESGLLTSEQAVELIRDLLKN